MALPIVALGGYGVIAFLPVLGIIRWVKIAENSLDYSLNNTVRHALFLPLSREEKYNAKQAIDTFFWRAGDLLSAGLVFLGTQMLAFNTQHFAMVNMVLVALWLMIAFWTGRENAQMTGEEKEMSHRGAKTPEPSRAKS